MFSVIIPAMIADRKPAVLHLFRNYDAPYDEHFWTRDTRFKRPRKPQGRPTFHRKTSFLIFCLYFGFLILINYVPPVHQRQLYIIADKMRQVLDVKCPFTLSRNYMHIFCENLMDCLCCCNDLLRSILGTLIFRFVILMPLFIILLFLLFNHYFSFKFYPLFH